MQLVTDDRVRSVQAYELDEGAPQRRIEIPIGIDESQVLPVAGREARPDGRALALVPGQGQPPDNGGIEIGDGRPAAIGRPVVDGDDLEGDRTGMQLLYESHQVRPQRG